MSNQNGGAGVGNGTGVVRPAHVTDAMLVYLDDLRDSGAVNMFGAGVYLQDAFGLSRHDARSAVLYWMATFSQRHPN